MAEGKVPGVGFDPVMPHNALVAVVAMYGQVLSMVEAENVFLRKQNQFLSEKMSALIAEREPR